MNQDIISETIFVKGHNNDVVKAYFTRPLNQSNIGSVLVIHHMPGWDASTLEIARKFATLGYATMCPHLHYRYGPDLDPEDAAALAREQGGVPDEQLLGDVDGSIQYLKSLGYTNKKVGVIGYCSGGRQAFLVGCELEVNAIVDCYGAFVARTPDESFPLKVEPVLPKASKMSAPLLGLFGNEDQFPSPGEVDEIEEELKRLGKVYEFYRYDGAGHAFFNVDRDSFHPKAASDGWKKIENFFGKNLT